MSVLQKNIIMEIGSYIAGMEAVMSNTNNADGSKDIPTTFRRKIWS